MMKQYNKEKETATIRRSIESIDKARQEYCVTLLSRYTFQWGVVWHKGANMSGVNSTGQHYTNEYVNVMSGKSSVDADDSTDMAPRVPPQNQRLGFKEQVTDFM